MWSTGVEPASRAWRARILAVERRPQVQRSVNPMGRGDAGSYPSGLQRDLPSRGVLLEKDPRSFASDRLAARGGIDPPSTGQQPAVLPLDDLASHCLHRDGESNPGFRAENPASCLWTIAADVGGATDGTCTRDLRLDGPALPLAELRRHRSSSAEQCAPWASNPVSSGVRARCPTSQA